MKAAKFCISLATMIFLIYGMCYVMLAMDVLPMWLRAGTIVIASLGIIGALVSALVRLIELVDD